MNVINFIIALVLFLVLDFLWLKIIASNIYKKELGKLLKRKFGLLPGLVVYVLLSLGVVLFVLNNILVSDLFSTFLIGALLGFIFYGIYDFTNLSILKGWSIKITIIDITWGTFLVGIVSFLTKYLGGLW